MNVEAKPRRLFLLNILDHDKTLERVFHMISELKTGIFAPRAMVDQVHEGLCYQRNLTFSICLT